MFRSVRVSVAVAALASVFLIGAGAAQAAINAKGSVEQVYATGARAGRKVKLVDATGKGSRRRRRATLRAASSSATSSPAAATGCGSAGTGDVRAG